MVDKVTGNTAAILEVASYFPEISLDNETLARENPSWDVEKLFEKTGVRSRQLAAPGQCASDLGVLAAQRLFREKRCNPETIDFLIFCTQSPDYFLPTTACLIQERLGLEQSCGALDVNLGCSGFVYCLSLGKGLIESGSAKRVLLITAETYSKFISPSDRSVRAIFGDGAAATLIAGVDSREEIIGPFVFGTDGRGRDHLIVSSGGLRNRPFVQTKDLSVKGSDVYRQDEHLYMNGAEVFNFSIKTVPPLIETLLKKACMEMDQIDYFIFHQASRVVLEHLRKKLGIPKEKFHINMELCGNTVSSTIPIALETAQTNGAIKRSDMVLLAGFGVGFSWAGTIVKVV